MSSKVGLGLFTNLAQSDKELLTLGWISRKTPPKPKLDCFVFDHKSPGQCLGFLRNLMLVPVLSLYRRVSWLVVQVDKWAWVMSNCSSHLA